MQQLSCADCGNRVLVEKYSPTHTSVQWLEEATVCPEFARHAALGEATSAIPTCGSLKRSIEDAAIRGILPTDSPRSYPVPGRLV
jgi:hypothetical protein